MSKTINMESLVITDIENEEYVRLALERYSGIKLDNKVENDLIQTFLVHMNEPEWNKLRKAIYYYAFYFIDNRQADYLANNLLDSDEPFKLMELDPMIEASILSAIVYNYAAEVAVIVGERSKLFKDTNKWIVDLANNDLEKAKPFINKVGRFAYRFFKRFNSPNVEDAIKPILEDKFNK